MHDAAGEAQRAKNVVVWVLGEDAKAHFYAVERAAGYRACRASGVGRDLDWSAERPPCYDTCFACIERCESLW